MLSFWKKSVGWGSWSFSFINFTENLLLFEEERDQRPISDCLSHPCCCTLWDKGEDRRLSFYSHSLTLKPFPLPFPSSFLQVSPSLFPVSLFKVLGPIPGPIQLCHISAHLREQMLSPWALLFNLRWTKFNLSSRFPSNADSFSPNGYFSCWCPFNNNSLVFL